MQGYDSVAVDADIEFGGTDQRFNLLMGRDIQTFYGLNKMQVVIMMPLIEGTDGVVKMSKTYPEHCISLTEEPKNMYGKLMSIPDELMEKYFTFLTDIEFNKENNPRDEKMRLAYEITKMYNGKEKADEAQNEFINVVQNKGIPDDIEEFAIKSSNIVDILVDLNFAQSKGEAKRLIAGGAVKFNNEKITDIQTKIEEEGILQGGKRKYAKIKI